MHGAVHRALRELWAFNGSLERHWSTLARRLEPAEPDAAAVLREGARASLRLRDDLRPAAAERGIHLDAAAETAGRFASVRPVSTDVLLERNQALRWAVHDVVHVATLLGYLGRLAAAEGDETLRRLIIRSEAEMRASEDALRTVAVALGDRPDDAVQPADPSSLGVAGQRFASSVGAAGEWLDRQLAGRRAGDG